MEWRRWRAETLRGRLAGYEEKAVVVGWWRGEGWRGSSARIWKPPLPSCRPLGLVPRRARGAEEEGWGKPGRDVRVWRPLLWWGAEGRGSGWLV